MRTLIRGGWVVGFACGTHALWRDGVLVFEDERVLPVGARLEGRTDREIDARGKLVAPGFIDTHVHSPHRASHRLITDTGRPDYYGQPFLDISVPGRGTRVGGDPRYLRPDDLQAGRESWPASDARSLHSRPSGIPVAGNTGMETRCRQLKRATLDEVRRTSRSGARTANSSRRRANRPC